MVIVFMLPVCLKAGQCGDLDVRLAVKESDIVVWVEAINSPSAELERYKTIGKLTALQNEEYASILSREQIFGVVRYFKNSEQGEKKSYGLPLSVAPLRSVIPGDKYVLFLNIEEDKYYMNPCLYIDVSKRQVVKNLHNKLGIEYFIDAMNALSIPPIRNTQK